jgi:putative pyruvate formate lyase activating enzyme
MLRVARAALHEWEEPPISVGAGSGAVFFSCCPLRCSYCQNADIAQGVHGTDIDVSRLADIFMELQDAGAANINLVTPTQYLPFIVPATDSAHAQGLNLPIVYNTSGYECASTIRGVAGSVDVYLTDFKYWRNGESDAALRYSHAPDYFEYADTALDAMVETVGEPRFDEWNEGNRLIGGVVVRHLLLPGRLEDSRRILSHLWNRHGDGVLYSIMNQYTPMHRYPATPELDCKVPDKDYERLLDSLDSIGMTDYFWQQGDAASESFIPPFDSTGVLPA